MEEPELAVRERGRRVPRSRLSPRQVERRLPGPETFAVLAADSASRICTRTRAMQLVERERLGEVVARTEFEPTQLGRQVRAGRQDQDRELWASAMNFAEQRQAVDAGKQQVEDDEVEALM